MLDGLMEQMEEQKKELKEKLAQIKVESEAGNGAIKVTANAARQIEDISIDKESLDWDDTDQIEDLLVIAINEVLEKATEKEVEESQKMLKDMMPGGPGMFGMLNKLRNKGLDDLF